MIDIRGVTKLFQSDNEAVRALDYVNLNIPDRSFFTLLGPSGCGKSTLLRCVAGLETPSSGQIAIKDRLVFDLTSQTNEAPSRRNIGMVFQSYAIWPHMTVFKNVAYPLEVRRKRNIRPRVVRALEMVELAHLAQRYASKLSGGQQQRIALARAIVAEPDILLLDEPLSNLDAALRDSMRIELRKLQRQLAITTLYVTHDQSEALSMSDWVAVMRNGQVEEVAIPEELYFRPDSAFAAQFIGGANVIDGNALNGNRPDGNGIVDTSVGQFQVKGEVPLGPVKLFIRPEKVRLLSSAESAAAGITTNRLECRVRGDLFVGDGRELDLEIPAQNGTITFRCRSKDHLALQDGKVVVYIDPADIRVLRST